MSIVLKLRWVKLDTNAAIRWKRALGTEEVVHEESGEAAASTARRYQSRLIQCCNCQAVRETAHMQLRTTKGYRSVTCTACHHHARVGRCKCACGVIWHQCIIHRIDPALHRSTKSKRKLRGEHLREELALRWDRAAPDIRDNACAWKRRRVHRDRVLHQYGGTMSAREAPAVRLSAELNPILSARFPHLMR